MILEAYVGHCRVGWSVADWQACPEFRRGDAPILRAVARKEKKGCSRTGARFNWVSSALSKMVSAVRASKRSIRQIFQRNRIGQLRFPG